MRRIADGAGYDCQPLPYHSVSGQRERYKNGDPTSCEQAGTFEVHQ